MAEPSHPSDPQRQSCVALVMFQVAHFRVALEARHVLSMSDHPSQLRNFNAQSLLYSISTETVSPPDYWLTLKNSLNNSQTEHWQLGVSGKITLQQLPAFSIHPMPKLLLSRRFSPALCGMTFVEQQLVLLLDAGKLAPAVLASHP